MIEYQGYKVSTSCVFPNFNISYALGTTKINIINSQIDYLKNQPPKFAIKHLTKFINGLTNGTYEIKFDIRNVLGKDFNTIKLL